MPDLDYLINQNLAARLTNLGQTANIAKLALIAEADAAYRQVNPGVTVHVNEELMAYLNGTIAPPAGMPIVRSYETLAQATRLNASVTKPAGTVSGDTVLIIFPIITATASPPTVGLPTGFTLVAGFPQLVVMGTNTSRTYVWWKIAGGSEPASYAVPNTSAACSLYCCSVRNTHATTPLSPAPTKQARVAQPVTAPTALTLTTLAANTLVIFWAVATDLYTGVSAVPTGTTPTFTKRFDNGAVLYVADGTMAAAAATGDKSNTNNNGPTNTSWGAGLIAVRGV